MKNEVILRFGIWGFEDITHDEISKALGLAPAKLYFKGQKKNPKFSALAVENGWLYQPSNNTHSPFEEQLQSLLETIEGKKKEIELFCNKYYCEISCGVFIYFENDESAPSIHLDAHYNNVLRALNIAFDVDIYCLPNA